VGISISGTIEDGMAAMSAKFKEMGSSSWGGLAEGITHHSRLVSIKWVGFAALTQPAMD